MAIPFGCLDLFKRKAIARGLAVDRREGMSSALGGAKQIDLLRDKWVRIQDVQPSMVLGRIALSDDTTLESQLLN